MGEHNNEMPGYCHARIVIFNVRFFSVSLNNSMIIKRANEVSGKILSAY